MKILHYINGRCNPDTANGVDKTVYFLCRAEAGLGHEVHLVCETEKILLPIEGVTLHRVKPVAVGLSCPKGIREIIDRVRPDFGHFHSAYVPGNLRVSAYLRRRGIPYCVTPNGNCSRTLMKRRPWLKLPYKTLLEKPFMNAAAFVHSVGDRGEIEHYGVTVPIVDALNGIDPETLPATFDLEIIRRKIPRFAERFTCTFVGRLDVEQKGLDLLIEAVGKLSENDRKVGIILVGPEWKGSRSRLEKMIAEAGVEDFFHFYGPAYGSEKYDILTAADSFIYPSRWEGLPFAVVEAMAVRQLCLVTPASDPAGLIEKSDAGIVFPTSVEGIADGISRAMDLNDSEKELLLTSASQIVRDEMDWKIIASRVLAACERALKTSGGN